jgi:hypothetical protein
VIGDVRRSFNAQVGERLTLENPRKDFAGDGIKAAVPFRLELVRSPAVISSSNMTTEIANRSD